MGMRVLDGFEEIPPNPRHAMDSSAPALHSFRRPPGWFARSAACPGYSTPPDSAGGFLPVTRGLHQFTLLPPFLSLIYNFNFLMRRKEKG